MKGQRLSRVADLLRNELAEILSQRLADPRIGMVTVMGVEVAQDLSVAKVFVSFLAPGEEFEERVKILNHAVPKIQHELRERHLDLRKLPHLLFKPDHSLERAQRIQELLRGIQESEPPAAQAGDEDA